MSDSPKHNSSKHSIPESCHSSIHDFIDSVNRESIITIAVSVRRRTLPSDSDISCRIDPNPKTGTYNAVWLIEFDDDIQWAFRTPFTDWSPALEKRFQSDVRGIQLIQSRMSVPIPRIIDFSVTQDNTFGRPYIIMERVKGVPLHELWFDPTWFSDEKRQAVFRSLASTISQLKTLEFTQIGSISYENGEYTVGPLLPLYQDFINQQTEERGPYNTVHSFLMDTLAQKSPDTSRTAKSALRMLAGCPPDERLDGPPFVLAMPDYDVQNVYIDNDGNVTGLLDWDDIVVGPREAGYAQYPIWTRVTRDIDIPFSGFDFQMAALDHDPFPPREEVLQDWPDVQPVYRAEFLRAFRETDPVSAVYTRNSHLVATLIREVFFLFDIGRIEINLFSHMFSGVDALYSDLVERGLERGEWTREFE